MSQPADSPRSGASARGASPFQFNPLAPEFVAGRLDTPTLYQGVDPFSNFEAAAPLYPITGGADYTIPGNTQADMYPIYGQASHMYGTSNYSNVYGGRADLPFGFANFNDVDGYPYPGGVNPRCSGERSTLFERQSPPVDPALIYGNVFGANRGPGGARSAASVADDVRLHHFQEDLGLAARIEGHAPTPNMSVSDVGQITFGLRGHSPYEENDIDEDAEGDSEPEAPQTAGHSSQVSSQNVQQSTPETSPQSSSQSVQQATPQASLHFDTIEAVIAADAKVAWRAPSGDITIPGTPEERRAVVLKLIEAIKNNIDCKGQTSKGFTRRWVDKDYYNDIDLEKLAWRLLHNMLQIHEHGWTTPIYDYMLARSIFQTKEWIFQNRLNTVIVLLKYSKRTCDDLMKDEKMWSVVGAPHMLVSRTSSNDASNKRKAVRIAFATENMKPEDVPVIPRNNKTTYASNRTKRARTENDDESSKFVTSKTQKKQKKQKRVGRGKPRKAKDDGD